jgi:hypothetical protein
MYSRRIKITSSSSSSSYVLPLAIESIPNQTKKQRSLPPLPPLPSSSLSTSSHHQNGLVYPSPSSEEDPRKIRLCVQHLLHVEQIRKRAYLCQVDKQLPLDIAGCHLYLQPWPYRDTKNTSNPFILPLENENGNSKSIINGNTENILDSTCMREISTYQTLGALSSTYILQLVGIVFPNEMITSSSSSFSFSSSSINSSISNISNINNINNTKLKQDQLYLAFEKPLHIYSGLIEASIQVSTSLCHQALYDLFQAVSLCHENGYVHRFLATCHSKLL